MTSLVKPKLGTDPNRGWQYYAIHLANSYVVKEFFLTANYQSCIVASEKLETEVGRWALEMRSQDYHELYTHAFIGMWAAFEAGVEDTVASVIERDNQAARAAVSRFKKDRYPIDMWPWSRTLCAEISQKLDQKARDATPNGGTDLFSRIRTTCSWVDVPVDEDSNLSIALAEASMVRNIIVHRYGQIDEGDAIAIPSLSPWVGNVMPIGQEKFIDYYRAITGTLMALMRGMAKSRHAGA